MDKNSLRVRWLLGRVVKVSPGQDRWVHVAEIEPLYYIHLEKALKYVELLSSSWTLIQVTAK